MSSGSKIEVQTYPWQDAPASLTNGARLFAIGDVHGYAEHLRALQRFIVERLRKSMEPGKATVVWLGDYIDRGPEPAECLDLVRQGLGVSGVREIALIGNHEKFLLDIVDDPHAGEDQLDVWRTNGGRETIARLAPGFVGADARELARALRCSLGEARLEFLRGLALTHRVGPYLCVHAGIDPGRDLAQQLEEDLIWIREPFLHPARWPFEVTVVHGHTPQMPAAHGHRIGVDSGVYLSSQLTAVELHRDRMRFFAAVGEEARSFDWSYLC